MTQISVRSSSSGTPFASSGCRKLPWRHVHRLFLVPRERLEAIAPAEAPEFPSRSISTSSSGCSSRTSTQTRATMRWLCSARAPSGRAMKWANTANPTRTAPQEGERARVAGRRNQAAHPGGDDDVRPHLRSALGFIAPPCQGVGSTLPPPASLPAAVRLTTFVSPTGVEPQSSTWDGWGTSKCMGRKRQDDRQQDAFLDTDRHDTAAVTTAR